MQGMTPEQYDERIRYGLATEQIPGSIQASAFTSKALAQSLTELAEQRRDVQGLAFRTQDYASKVQPTDAQIKPYYDAHRNDFATPETATIQYLVLSPATLAASIKPSDADLKKYYDDNIARYRTEGRSAGKPHPDQRAEGRERGRQGEGQAEGRRTARASEGASGPVRADRAEEFGRPGFGVEGRRPWLLQPRHDRGRQGVRRRRVQAQEGRDQRCRAVGLRLSHHPGNRREAGRPRSRSTK